MQPSKGPIYKNDQSAALSCVVTQDVERFIRKWSERDCRCEEQYLHEDFEVKFNSTEVEVCALQQRNHNSATRNLISQHCWETRTVLTGR